MGINDNQLYILTFLYDNQDKTFNQKDLEKLSGFNLDDFHGLLGLGYIKHVGTVVDPVSITAKGKTYIQEYRQSLIEKQEKANYDKAVYGESRKSNLIQFWTLIVSLAALLASIAVPLILFFLQQN